MTSDPRFVLDTGVIVSAVLLPRSLPRQTVDLAFARGIVLASADTIGELVVRFSSSLATWFEPLSSLFAHSSPSLT